MLPLYRDYSAQGTIERVAATDGLQGGQERDALPAHRDEVAAHTHARLKKHDGGLARG